MVLLNLLTLGLWSKLGRLTHYAFDAVLLSAFLAGMKRSTGLTPSFKKESVVGDNKEMGKWVEKYLGVGELMAMGEGLGSVRSALARDKA